MSRKLWITLIVSLAFILLFASCERPASKAPVGTPSIGEAIKTPLPVDQQILNATMTAQAIMEKFNQPTPTPGGGIIVPTTDPANETPVATTPSVQTAIPTMQATPILTKPATYTIHDGEYVYCLARRFDVNPLDLLALNGLSQNSVLSGGMTLKIPTSGSFPGPRALHAHPDTYTVSSGETIYDVACYYGDVAPESIIAVNGLVEPFTLTSKQVLQIP
ncbi:MAG: LysM peptidoglycan-binding domain-containing protein [Anaerolineaceae bacterium]|nr:LysM peptidoglycan-binding domain-containing protein [Anaerolineaceae bacterium]